MATVIADSINGYFKDGGVEKDYAACFVGMTDAQVVTHIQLMIERSYHENETPLPLSSTANELNTTVNGVIALTNILKLVRSKTITSALASSMFVTYWGMTKEEADNIVSGVIIPPKTNNN